MKKFTEIVQFRNVVKGVRDFYQRTGKTLTKDNAIFSFSGTVKLHGTNAGVRRKNGKFQPQSRENIIDVTNDNYGFAKFISNIPEEDLNKLFDMISAKPEDDVTIFGEWIGKGIQSKAAVSQLDRQWVLFGAWVNDNYVQNDDDWELPDYSIFNILRLPLFHITINFAEPEEAVAQLTQFTEEVEAECPWAREFGVHGVGEGIVWTCDDLPYSDLWFKTKGQKHSGKGDSKKKKVTVDPQKVESILQVIDIIVTHERLQQGIEHLHQKGLDIDPKNIGLFIKWVNKDIQKEELDTIEANGLVWKDVQKAITARAKEFFFDALVDF